MSEAKRTARVWLSADESFDFPERSTSLERRTAPVGLCLSGGGTRAMCAGWGQLRGLRAIGVLDEIRYVSCVSGGSWIATAFTYYATGAEGDDAFLGPVTPPSQITMAALSADMPRDCAGWTATRAVNPIFAELGRQKVPKDRLWIEGIAQAYFEPWGLHHPDAPHLFTLDAASLADIRARNPALSDAPFDLVRDPERRPYLIVNGAVVGVTSLGPQEVLSLAPLEVTPIYSGSPFGQEVLFSDSARRWESHWLGGVLVESMAMGATGGLPLADGLVAAEPPERPYSLVDASGMSSACFAGLVEQIPGGLDVLNPSLWLGSSRDDATTAEFTVGDGGVLENYGLLALLRRKLPRIIVCVNTVRPLDLDYDPATQTPTTDEIDTYLPPLFGFSQPSSGLNTAGNRVFRPNDFVGVVRALQAAKRAGGPVAALTRLEVQANTAWRIEGGWEVEILWMYLDTSARFEEAIVDEGVLRELAKRRRPARPLQGRLAGFPNYSTTFPSGTDLVQLNPEQVRLLADLTCWSVMECEALIAPWFEDRG